MSDDDMKPSNRGLPGSGKSIFLLGLVIFLAAFPVLFLNETRYLRHYQDFAEKKITEAASAGSTAKGQTDTENNKVIMFRLAGFFMMLLGMSLLLKTPSRLRNAILMSGNIAETGVGIVAFLISASLCFITISVAWLMIRPLLSIALIAVAASVAASTKLLPKRQAD